MPEFIDPASLAALHGRLLIGDRRVPDELCRMVLSAFQAELQRRFPGTDPHLISDGIIDAVLDYCERPQQFDTTRNVPLDRFLVDAAWRNIDNSVRGEGRRKVRERKAAAKKQEAAVALDPAVGNTQQEELREADVTKAAMLAVLTDPKDKAIFALRADGVRETAAYAQVLDITHLTVAEQRKTVKRHKERVIKLLRRRGFAP